MKRNFIFNVFIIVAITLSAKNSPVLPNGFKEQKAPAIAFTENKGQVHDQNHKPRPDVLFSARSGNMTFYLKTEGVSYQLSRIDSWKEFEDVYSNEKRKEINQQTIYRIDLNWLNANKNFTKSTDYLLEGSNNYYLTSCEGGVLNVQSYSGVTLHNLYNGINLHYYEQDGQLKHDYIVAPNTDYKQIQIKVEGASVSINKDGSLLLTTPLGKVQEGAPKVYQNGRQIKAKWLIHMNILSFEIDEYDPNYELLIDPVTRLWGTYYGGSALDYGSHCITDNSGFVYMAGYTSSVGNIATTGSHQTIFAGGSWDAYLVKFNSSGVRIWSSYYGGSGTDYGWSCTTDGTGNVYLSGDTDSPSGIASPGSHQTSFGNVYDAFLVKFNSSGVRQWATYYGGSGTDYGKSCKVDGFGNVYLTGLTNSTVNIATSGAHQSSFGGTFDAFLAKFNNTGVLQWGTYYGGAGTDRNWSCAVDATGNVYTTGQTTSSSNIATSGAHQTIYAGSVDAYLTKWSSNGVVQWSTYIGGNSNEIGWSCISDGSGNVYVSGETASSAGISTIGGHQTTYGGWTSDAFLVKFNTVGILQWGTYYGGGGVDYGYSCTSDGSGNIYLSGYTGSTSNIATASAYQTIPGGGVDAFLAKFNNNGIRQWGTYYGGSDADYGRSCTADGFGNVFLSGETFFNSNFTFASPGAHQPVHAGGSWDAYIAKFSDCSSLSPVASVNASVCVGSVLNFSATISGTATPSFSWSGPNSYTSNIQFPSLTASGTINIGVYTLTINNGGCVETSTTQVIAVNPLPIISVNSGTICFGKSFTITPIGASTYTIEGGNAVVNPTTTTSYTVIGTSTAGCISANTATSNVTVNITPTVAVNNGTICSGNSFTIVPIGASTYTIEGGNAVVNPTTTTSYTVVGTSTAGCVSANTATSNVIVNITPTVAVNNGTICSGNSFTIVPIGASTYTIEGGNAVVNPTTTTSYTVVGTSTAGCISANTATSNVIVNSLPIVNATSSSAAFICVGQSATLTASGASNYTWNPGGTGNSILISPTVTTNYTVTGTDLNGCSNIAVISQSVSPCSGISENNDFLMVQIYPNPVNEILNINFGSLNNTELRIEIINSIGQIVMFTLVKNTIEQLDLTSLTSGAYILRVMHDQHQILYYKLIKK